jgi:hypothetical protein
VFTAKSCKDGDEVADALKLGCQLREKPLTEEKYRSSRIAGIAIGLTTQPRKMICCKILERPGPSWGHQANDDDDDDDDGYYYYYYYYYYYLILLL